MCNPNNSFNKIAPAKVEQFNLTITAWCVRIYTCYLLLLVYTLDLLPRPGVKVFPRTATHDNSTSVKTYCVFSVGELPSSGCIISKIRRRAGVGLILGRLVYKSIHGLSSAYLSEIIKPYAPE